MPIYDLSKIAEIELIPGFLGKMVHTGNMTIAYWKVKAGSRLPEHAHFHEQVTYVMEGRFEMQMEGVIYMLEPGMVAVIPANAIHAGVALTDCNLIDVFQPVREDYKALTATTNEER